jgi:ATP-binding protein involved in chromosome partitioning
MSLTDTLRSAIAAVRDPDLERTLGDLNAIRDIIVENNDVNVYLELVQPVHWIAQNIDEAAKAAVRDVNASLNCIVHAIEKETPRIGNAHVLPQVKNLIAVASGKGGVGKSTMAANLACALSLRGARVGLLDADIYGPSAPTMFGLHNATMNAEKMEDGRIVGYPNVQYGIEIASIGFVMQRDQAAILRGPMLAGYFKTLVEQINWGDLDFLIFDLPPGTGDIQLTLTQQIPLTGAVIVTTPQEIALADVRRSIAMFNKVQVDVLGVVENMSYFIPPDAPEKKYYIFGEGGGRQVAHEAGVPLLGNIPINLALREGADDGLPAVMNPDTDYSIAATISDMAAAVVRQTRIINSRRSDAPKLTISL